MSDREQDIALREAAEIEADDAYFGPRPIEDGAMQRRAFAAGFERAWRWRGEAMKRLQDAAAANTLPTVNPGQCPMCGEYSMAARAHQGLYGTKVEL